MLKLRMINKPKMYKLKCNFTFPNIILANMQEKEVNPTKEVQEVIPDIQYDGLSKVTVNAVTNEIDENIVPENIKNGVNILGIQGNVIELNGDILNVSPTKNEQEFTPVFPKNGFTKVNILGTKLQNKEVIPTKESQIIIADDDNIGLNQVTVNPIPDEYVIPTGTLDINSNGTYDVTDYESANVNVQPTLQEKTQTITENGSYIFEPDNDYYGLNKVIANVNVPTKTLGTKTIAENGTYKASDDNLDGYNEVSVQVKGTEPQFTGHYDKIGLKTIGWSDEEINYYQKNGVQWNSTEDEYFKLTDTEFAGDDSKNTRFLPKNTTKTEFGAYYKLIAIPMLDTSNVNNMQGMFMFCYSLTTIPQLDTNKVTRMDLMFQNCYSLTTIPQLDTSNVTNMNSMFKSCYSLTTIPQINTSNVNSMFDMFNQCYSLKTIPQLNTSKVTRMDSMFNQCYSLTTIPQLDTSNVTNMNSMFYECYSLIAIPLLSASNITSVSNFAVNCKLLTDFGGLENLGQAYLITQSANYSNYKLNLSTCTALTEQSLINVLNNLYDIATKGCKVQQVVLGSTNLAKLTSAEGQQALTNATAKGWSVS